VAVSGLLEAGAAVGLLVPATRRAAAGCVTAMFTLFLWAWSLRNPGRRP